MAIRLRLASRPALDSDEAKVLVERPLPKRLAGAKLTAWLPELAPSHELRAWFDERPSQWPVFVRRYLAELRSPEATAQLEQLRDIVRANASTALLATYKDPVHNHAALLKSLLEGMKKPPSTTGAVGAASVQRKRARRPL